MNRWAEICGKTYALSFPLSSVIRAQEIFGQKITPAGRENSLLLYAALCENHPSVTRLEAEDLARHLTLTARFALRRAFEESALPEGGIDREEAERFIRSARLAGITADISSLTYREICDCVSAFAKKKERLRPLLFSLYGRAPGTSARTENEMKRMLEAFAERGQDERP